MADDYYQVLGVARDASEDEIQKAYRKQARKYHPDLHADKDDQERKRVKERFQQIQHAYDVLSDPQKRQMYDQFGPQFEQMGGAAGGQSPFGPGGQNPFGPGGIDLGDLFGGGRGGGGFEDMLRQMGGQRQTQAPPARGQDIEQQITIPFAVAVLGGKHQVVLQRPSGKQDRLDVTIPAGMESGKKIRLRGQGFPGPGGGNNGDLLIKVDIAPHPVFNRKGLNLMIDVPITILEAARGAKIDLATPHGTVSLKVPAGTSSGKTLRLKGMGIKSGTRSGDLLANLLIVVPDEISDDDLKALGQLSPAWNTDVRQEIRW